MSTATKATLTSALAMFEDFDASQVGDLPSFDPFPVGVYRNLRLTGEVVTSGTKEGKDYWQRLEIGVNIDADTEIELATQDVVPADGSQHTFTYTIMQSDKETGEVKNVTAPHKAKGRDGDEYDAAGSFARINKDWIQTSKGAIANKDIPARMKLLATEPRVGIQLGKRAGKADENGVKPVYQTIVAIMYPA